MLTDLTAYDSVRVVLGLSTRELPDTTLGVELYDLVVETEVLSLAADAYTQYTTASGESTPEADAYVRALRLFATHCVAFKCLEALPLFASKAITDGKAGVYRDGNSPYLTTVDKVTAAYYRSKRGAEEAYATYTSTTVTAKTPVTIGAASTPNYDPVTGT